MYGIESTESLETECGIITDFYIVLTATATTGRSGKALKNRPDMEKDRNLIKNTTNWEQNGRTGCARLLQYFLLKTTMI